MKVNHKKSTKGKSIWTLYNYKNSTFTHFWPSGGMEHGACGMGHGAEKLRRSDIII